MRVTWVPFSAVGLVAGAAALFAGALVTPMVSDDETLTLVRFEDERWLIVATFYFAAACALTLGLPSILTLFRTRNRLGLVAIGVFVIGCLGIAGYAMLLFFMRALAVTHSADHRPQRRDRGTRACSGSSTAGPARSTSASCCSPSPCSATPALPAGSRSCSSGTC